MTTGEKLKQLRGDRPIKEVCESTGIHEKSLYAYENDYRLPNRERMVALASYYKVSVEYLFFE